MGKKILSQVQEKISKSSSEKKQLNSLIKVLRPKVYITDSSSFKSLVQQLTGNGTSATVSQSILPSSSSSYSLPQIVEKLVPVIDVGLDDHGNPESSLESSFDESLDSFQVCNHLAWSSEEINQPYHPMHFDETISEHLFMNIQQQDSLAYGDLQSLLQLDGDSFNLHSQIQQELSIYDYELSGLI
ncbi:hypothetical protein CRYUN_Cryun14cG0153800 [Craigia yunnanensis]